MLDGEKRYITNGAIADVLTVMARTPVPGREETQVTAFLVTPDMPGFRVVEPRMEKLGIRGTATARLAFDDMHVPKENILGPLGKGLKVALTVLDFGRTTFGAAARGWQRRVYTWPPSTPERGFSSAGRWVPSSWCRRSWPAWRPGSTPCRP